MALDKVKAKLEAVERQKSEPIAIIGMACRFPGGANTPEAFFQLLQEGSDAVTEVPAQRWQIEAAEDAASDPERRATRWGGFLREGVEGFDAGFFNISPREANHLDPQQRLLLEVGWEALERAGQDPARLVGSRTGVFVGLTSTDYADLCRAAGPAGEDAYALTGNGHCFAPGRLSYSFGFQGPCIAVDTACSSSLVSVHLACQSLRAGEATLALAGGVNLMLSPDTTRLLATTQGLSSDGRCKTFDAAANGFVRSEGCGLVVLKLLSEAQRDGDTILGLIRGSAVNQDGRSTGLTTPNVLSQQAMLQQALASARVSAGEIGYIETHGTGTSLGDPIEFEALRAVVGKSRLDGTTCVLGAVKTNIGHLEAAAGIAGLIKAVMVLQREMIPKNLHFRALNPRMSLDGTPFVIPTDNLPWTRGERSRFAGVSSFGMSGTNAHLILEEAPSREPAEASARTASTYLLPISAKSPEALEVLARLYAEMLARADGTRLSDIAYTASVRRTHHEHRIAVVGQTREQLAESLAARVRSWENGGTERGRAAASARPKVVFVFPGQGSQWLGMGRQLFAKEAVFRDTLAACDEAILRQGGFSLLEELEASEGRSRLLEIDIIQPLLFAIEVALAALWRSWGVAPDCVIGHSMGEVAAAHVAGILSLEDAAKVICRRSRLLRRVSGKGAMAVVELPLPAAQEALSGYEGQLSIAVSNGPRSTVISGNPAALEELLATLEKAEVFCRRVKVDVASHSPQMDPLRDELLTALRNVRPGAARIAMRSTVTGELVKGPELDAQYWVKNLREPVLFSSTTQRMMKDGHTLFVEMSPHPILLPSIEENLVEAKQEGAAVASLRRSSDERFTMLEGVAALYARGYPVDWKRLAPADGQLVPLPTYPWRRERYWVEAARSPVSRAGRDVLAECVYAVEWRRKDRAALPAIHSAGAWLVIGDRGGLGAALVSLFSSRGQSAVRAIPGERFAHVEPDLYEVDPTSADAYQSLLRAAFGADRHCLGVVHLSSLDATPWENATAETLESDQRIGFLSALRIAQAILSQRWRDKPRLWLVTRGAQAVATEPVTGVAQAPIWGLGRTIAIEHPELGCSLVDLDATARGADGALDLLHEIETPDAETQVALRGSHRFVARLAQSSFDAVPAQAFHLEEGATYLITGGLGGLGLATAEWMVEQGVRHLALVGRRAPTPDAQRAIHAMEAKGAQVLVLAADVSKHDDVQRMFTEIAHQAPPLRGVVHAAGVGHDQTLLAQIQEESFWPVMAAKMFGGFHLHAATKGTPLDFFVYYSSASAALGLVGQAAYAAANAILDAMSHGLRGAGIRSVSVQWGPFSDAGLAVQHGAGERMGRGGLASLTPAQGCAALGRLLARPRAEVAIMSLSIQRWFDVFPEHANSPFWSELHEADGSKPAIAPAAVDFRQSLEAADPGARFAMLELYVREQLGAVLRLDASKVDLQQQFHFYGFDSLMGLELRNRLQAALKLQLSMADVITHAQGEALVKLLAERLDLTIDPRGSEARPEAQASGSWIVIPRPAPAARMRLFCFPYAGGAASVFTSWPGGLPPEVEMCAIQPPGRQERLHEPLPESVEEMVAALVPALLPYLDRPFAMFGHCLGAIVMFEVLGVLASKHGLRPAHVFVSGAPSPRQYLVPSMGARSPQEFVDLLRYIGFARSGVLEDKDAERDLLPAVRADFEVAARYAYVPSEPLDVPLTAFAGREDAFAPPNVVDAWRGQTSSWSSMIVFPGEHYFIVPERDALLEIVREELLLRLASIDQREHPEPRLRWLSSPAPRPSPRARLFCFPGVGRGTSVYASMPSYLDDDVEVCTIELPGRGLRGHELPLGRVDEIVEHLIPTLNAHLDRPYAFFGFDLGAIVMFEVARRLRRDGRPLPGHLFVGAAMAPQVYYFPPMHHLARERLFSGLRNLGASLDDGPAAERALRAECAAMASYAFTADHPFDVPVTVFVGDRDIFVPPGGMPAWNKQTTATFALQVCRGSHDLLRDDPSALLDTIGEAMAKAPFR